VVIKLKRRFLLITIKEINKRKPRRKSLIKMLMQRRQLVKLSRLKRKRLKEKQSMQRKLARRNWLH